MSIFGKLDAAAVSSNPFKIDAGDYNAMVVAAKFQKSRDGAAQLYIQYEITDADSAFLGNKAAKIYTLPDPELDETKLALLPPDEKKKVLQQVASLKRDLCGNETNPSQKGLGVPADELNDPDWDPAKLVDTEVIINITNNGDNNQYVNVRWVNLAE